MGVFQAVVGDVGVWLVTPLMFCVFVSHRYGIRPENVIVYGQSIGTVPSVDLASRYESAAVVLHSPLTSRMLSERSTI